MCRRLAENVQNTADVHFFFLKKQTKATEQILRTTLPGRFQKKFFLKLAIEKANHEPKNMDSEYLTPKRILVNLLDHKKREIFWAGRQKEQTTYSGKKSILDQTFQHFPPEGRSNPNARCSEYYHNIVFQSSDLLRDWILIIPNSKK